jgi:TIR domain/Sel1 repeat
MFALEGLPQEDRQRLPLLAPLPPSEPIDLATLAETSSISLSEAEAMAKRVAMMSLIAFDEVNRTVSISEPVHAFLRSLQLRQGRAEANRRSRSTAVEGIIGISYRRDDGGLYAARLYDQLSEKFGFDRLFMDIAILPGEDWVQAIQRRIDEAAAWLVVIGPKWVHSVNSRGERSLDDSQDYVRMEIAAALERRIAVIPVLVAGAAMPRSEELPTELRELARRQAIALDSSNFNQGVEELIYALEHIDAPPSLTIPPAEVSVDESGLRPASSSRIEFVEKREFGRRRSRRRLIFTIVAAAALVPTALVAVALLGVKLPYLSTLGPVPTAEKPNDAAMGIFELAEAYYFGRGVPRDYNRATELYEQAALEGSAAAENALGRMYESGVGVPRDLALATQWYKRAASKGQPDAKAALARLEAK